MGLSMFFRKIEPHPLGAPELDRLSGIVGFLTLKSHKAKFPTGYLERRLITVLISLGHALIVKSIS